MYQTEFNKLYDRLARFAEGVARRYFRYDESKQGDAVFEALSKFSDLGKQVGSELVYDPQIENIEAWGKTVIVNAIKDFSKVKKPLESIPLPYKELENAGIDKDDTDGFHGMELNG